MNRRIVPFATALSLLSAIAAQTASATDAPFSDANTTDGAVLDGEA